MNQRAKIYVDFPAVGLTLLAFFFLLAPPSHVRFSRQGARYPL